MDTALQVIKKTIEAHDSLEKCDVAFQQQNFIESVHCLQKVNSLLTSLSPVWEGRVEILKGLKTEYAVHREKLKYDMGEMWKNYLKWDIPELLEGERETGPTVLTLFKSREGKILPLESLANAMHSLGYLGTVLKVFGKQLQKHALEPIIVRQVEVDVVRSEDSTILKLKSRGVGPIVLPPVEVFQKLTTVLECLHDSFGKVVLNGVEEGSSQCLMRKLGEIIYKDFCDTLVKECLSPAIPSHRKAMSEYNKIVDAVTNFHAMLVTIEFLKPDDESILHYAQNVDALFAAKLCQDYLGRARKIMLEDLYDCISVQEAVSPINKCSVKSGMKSEAVSSPPEMTDPYPKDFSDKKYSSVNLLKFPQCRIR